MIIAILLARSYVAMKEVLSCLSLLMYADTPQFTSHLLTSALPEEKKDAF